MIYLDELQKMVETQIGPDWIIDRYYRAFEGDLRVIVHYSQCKGIQRRFTIDGERAVFPKLREM